MLPELCNIPPLDRVYTHIYKSLSGVGQVGVQGPVHCHLGEQPHDALLVSALDHLLKAGRGGHAEGVNPDPPLSLK